MTDHDPRPDDDPQAGDRCMDCGLGLTWIGPSQSDWEHVAQRVRAVHFNVGHKGQPDAQGLIRDKAGEVLMIDDNVTVPPGTLGTLGTVTSIDAFGTLHVRWDNGSRIGLLPDKDEYEVVW